MAGCCCLAALNYRIMTTARIVRFVFILALWLALCYLLVTRRGLDGMTVFILIVSGIVVWVPLYKKYIRDKK